MRSPLPALPLPGACLCGGVRYRITSPLLAINACHCLDCKRSSGATHGVFLHTTRSGVIAEGGALERYRKVADSGRHVDAVRCAECGTRLWNEPVSAPTLAFVAAGTLDESGWAVPTSHIWAFRRSASVLIEPDALVIESAPSDRQALWDRFKEIYG